MQAHGLNWLSQILLIKLKDIYGIRELKIFTEYVQNTNKHIYIQCKLFSYLPSVGLAQARPNNPEH